MTQIHKDLYSVELREVICALIKASEHPEGREDVLLQALPDDGSKARLMADDKLRLSPVPDRRRRSGTLTKRPPSEDFIAKRQFDSLVIVAPQHIPRDAKGRSGSTGRQASAVDKDLTMLDAAELRQRLVETVFPLIAGSR